ncbi:MAG: rubrerythrin family protein [Chthoniobacteraceae bacterium]|nr:rubrerythrin family protein [Chthoniobacteraceae bacterium]
MSNAFSKTIENLNAAFQGESNASNRYQIFAKTADAEGHAFVARLFRAASRAEALHRDSHKAAIAALGGEVKAFALDEVKPGSTAENLKAAIAGEVHERDVMYPEFLAVAKEEGAREAIRTMTFALKVEAQHAALYQHALDNLGKLADVPVYVCPICGDTFVELPAKSCPVCGAAVEKFEKIA